MMANSVSEPTPVTLPVLLSGRCRWRKGLQKTAWKQACVDHIPSGALFFFFLPFFMAGLEPGTCGHWTSTLSLRYVPQLYAPSSSVATAARQGESYVGTRTARFILCRIFHCASSITNCFASFGVVELQSGPAELNNKSQLILIIS